MSADPPTAGIVPSTGSSSHPAPSARISVLVPAKDEAENLPEFVQQCGEALLATGLPFEVVVINDGSRDDSARVLEALVARYPFLRVVTHRRQLGIAEALRSGSDAAIGDVLVFYPADLQYLPQDIPTLVGPIIAGEADMVTGSKQGKYEKRFVSGVYNRLCRWLFGVKVEDLNSVKAYRSEIMQVLPMRPDWHRYMVVIAAVEGFRLTSVPVPLYPRTRGVSKFTWRRIPIGVVDLISVWFQFKYGRKPMLFFGGGGTLFVGFGILVGMIAIGLRLAGHGYRPLLTFVEMMIISGFVLFGIGFVAEMVAGLREEVRELDRRSRQDTKLPPS